MFQTKIIEKIDQELIKQWKDLWGRAVNPNIFNSYEWFLTSQQTNSVQEYKLFTLFKDDKLVAIVPLQFYKCFGVPVYGSINKKHLIDTPFLVESYNKEIFKNFFNFIFTQNVFLQKIDEKSVAVLKKNFPHVFFSLIAVNPTLSLSGDPIASFSPSMVSQIKRNIRRNPGLHYESYTTNLMEHMKTVFKIQKRSSKHIRSMDIFEEGEVKKYYLTLTKNFPKAIHIAILCLNDKPIAYQYGFFCKTYYVGDQIAYINDYAKLGPGKLIGYYLIDDLKNHGAETLDQGGGLSTFKQGFTHQYRTLYNLYYSPNIFIMTWWKMINKVRRMRQIISPKKNTRDHEFLFKTY